MKKGLVSNALSILLCFLLAVSTGCGGKPEEELTKAYDILAEGNYNKALFEYQEIAHKYEDNADIKARAMYWIANIHLLYLNNTQMAVAKFEEFVLEFPSHPLALDSYWKIAAAYQEEFKDERQAISKYQRLIDHFPKSAEAAKAQLAIANCYAQKGDTQQAIIEARYLLSNYPASTLCSKTLLFIGDIQYQCGNFKPAKETYQELIKKYPASPTAIDAWYNLANVQEESREYKKALESFKEIETSYYNPDLIKHRIKRLQELIDREKRPRRRKKSRR